MKEMVPAPAGFMLVPNEYLKRITEVLDAAGFAVLGYKNKCEESKHGHYMPTGIIELKIVPKYLNCFTHTL
jgi:hypothetical protein